VEQRQWNEAQEQIGRVGKTLENAAETIQGAAQELGKTAR
jgi:hypothetical protein